MLAQLQYRTEIHKHNLYQVLCGTESVVELDPELVNVFDNPWITAMTWQHASLEAGDCLLIPAGQIQVHVAQLKKRRERTNRNHGISCPSIQQ